MDAKDGEQQVVGARCKLENDKGAWYVETPGSVTVRRSYDDLLIRCDKDRLSPGVALVKSSTKAMMLGNAIFGGVVGGVVDATTGAGYDYPGLITVLMGTTTRIAIPPPDDPRKAAESQTPEDGGPKASCTRTAGGAWIGC